MVQTKDTPILLTMSAYDLIDELDRLYPQRCLRKGEALEDAHRYSGARDLIDELVQMKAEEITTRHE